MCNITLKNPYPIQIKPLKCAIKGLSKKNYLRFIATTINNETGIAVKVQKQKKKKHKAHMYNVHTLHTDY